jgi:hypothetical protein
MTAAPTGQAQILINTLICFRNENEHNKQGAANPAMTLWFHIWHQRLRVGDLGPQNGSAPMNPFTTDHPLASKTSWFDTREHPALSFVCNSFVLALILTPFLLYRLYLFAISDIGADDPGPLFSWALFPGSVVVFVLSLFAAFPLVLLSRLLSKKIP